MVSCLEARVKNVNKVNACANEYHAALTEFFRGYVGKKVCNADHSLTKRVKDQLPTLPDSHNLRITNRAYEYYISFYISGHESWEHGCVSHEVTLYIGKLKDGVLTELTESPGYRTTYTTQEVEVCREHYRSMEKQYRDAQSALYPFGEYDR